MKLIERTLTRWPASPSYYAGSWHGKRLEKPAYSTPTTSSIRKDNRDPLSNCLSCKIRHLLLLLLFAEDRNEQGEELANLIYHGWARHNRNLFFKKKKITRWNTKFFREPFENPKSRKRKIICASAGRRQNREWTSEIKLASAQTIPHQSDKLWTGPIRMTKSICVVSDCALKSECYGDPSFMGKAVFVL